MRLLFIFLMLLQGAAANATAVDSATVIGDGVVGSAGISTPHGADTSPCGAAAFVYGTHPSANSFWPERLHVVEVQPWGGAPAITEVGLFEFLFLASAWEVAYDSQCRLHVFVHDSNTFRLYRREGNGWSFTEQQVDRIGGEIFELVDFFRAPDGRLCAFFQMIDYSTTPRGSRAALFTHEGDEWQSTDLGAFPIGRSYDAAIGSDGTLRVLGTMQSTFEYSDDLVLATWNGSWDLKTIHAATESDFFSTAGALAVAPDGTVHAAATIVKTVPTGSPIYRRLDYYECPPGGVWARRTIASSGDGYFGTDGNNFTGSNPRLARDLRGGLHLSFSDYAGWHEQFHEAAIGQWRYATRKPGATDWVIERLVAQPGQAQQSNPLHFLTFFDVVVSATGARVDLLAIDGRRQGDTITQRSVTLYHATNPDGGDASGGREGVLALLLARPVLPPWAPPQFDRNTDSSVDSGDLR